MTGARPSTRPPPASLASRHPAASPPHLPQQAMSSKSPEQAEYEQAMAKYYADMRQYEEELLPAYLALNIRAMVNQY